MEHAPNRFSLKDCRLACEYDPNCLVWQAFPIEKGRKCYQGYTGMNITCHPPGEGPGPMDGGRRRAPPEPAFRTDYVFARAGPGSAVDADWDVVDAPHDFIAERGNFTYDQSDQHHGYLPRNASWYRKHFYLPKSWKSDGGATFVHFEGVFHHATFFLNGKYLMSHECGYTGFDVRLDNATSINFGPDAENVLSLRADASFGSGHWYEGGGIYRPVHLLHVAPTHITRNGLFVPPEGDGSAIVVSAELETMSIDEESPKASVKFSIFTDASSSTAIAEVTSAAVHVPGGIDGTTIVQARLAPPPGSIKLWTTKSPTLYSVLAEVMVDGAAVDSVRTSVGFRSTTFSGAEGTPPFTLNGKPMHFRGFSHHNSIGGLGVAIPERVQLFRVQASRAMGRYPSGSINNGLGGLLARSD
jgi:beta-galactosidase/beta-glucuronidase